MVIAHLLDCKKAQMGGDLGPLLVSFFYRFGYGFDYTKDAVSINHGGFIRKRNAWKNKDKVGWLLLSLYPASLADTCAPSPSAVVDFH